MESKSPLKGLKLQKQISRLLAILFLVGLFFLAKAVFFDFRDTPATIEGHAPLKTNVQFRPVDGTPTDIPGYSFIDGRVDKVVDGDTLELISSWGRPFRLRLLGVDAPELQQNDQGKISKGFLQKLLGYCEYEIKVTYKDDNNYDSYGRLLGKATCNGKDLNLELVKTGHAWVDVDARSLLTEEDQSLYSRAEEEARFQQKGLWAEKNPEKPWEWRLKDKNNKVSSRLSDLYAWLRNRLGF